MYVTKAIETRSDPIGDYLTSIAHHSPRTISTYREILRMLQNRFLDSNLTDISKFKSNKSENKTDEYVEQNRKRLGNGQTQVKSSPRLCSAPSHRGEGTLDDVRPQFGREVSTRTPIVWNKTQRKISEISEVQNPEVKNHTSNEGIRCSNVVRAPCGNYRLSIGSQIEFATISELLKLLEDLAAHYQRPTMNTIRAVLRGYLKFCDREDDARQIKYANIRWLPRCDLTQEQLAEVLAASRSNERAIILTFYSTAARLGELAGMRFEHTRPQVSDIDWINGKIRIVAKGGKEDYLVFFLRREEAIAALHNYIGFRKTGPILSNRRHTYDMVRRAGARVGVKLHPHMLRHCAAHSLKMQNVNAHIIQAFMRHSTLAMTERYGALDKNDLITVAEQREWR